MAAVPTVSFDDRTNLLRPARGLYDIRSLFSSSTCLRPQSGRLKSAASKETPCRRAAFRLATNLCFIRSSWRLLAGVILVLGDKISLQRLATPSRHTSDLYTSERQHESSYRNLRARDFGWSATSVDAGASSLVHAYSPAQRQVGWRQDDIPLHRPVATLRRSPAKLRGGQPGGA